MSKFTILIVCTGNVCRSPLAERLLAHVFEDLPVLVHSAGTHALVDHELPAPQMRIAHELGFPEAAAHRGRQLVAEHLEDVDLVLTMTREHRSMVVRLNPQVVQKAFTLRELVRIGQEIAEPDLAMPDHVSIEERLRHAVRVASRNRGVALPPENPDDDDVVDPFRRSNKIYRISRDQLIQATNGLVEYVNRALNASSAS